MMTRRQTPLKCSLTMYLPGEKRKGDDKRNLLKEENTDEREGNFLTCRVVNRFALSILRIDGAGNQPLAKLFLKVGAGWKVERKRNEKYTTHVKNPIPYLIASADTNEQSATKVCVTVSLQIFDLTKTKGFCGG